MNLELFWLLASGKLNYLRSSGKAAYGVDPLHDWMWFALTSTGLITLALITALSAAVGFGCLVFSACPETLSSVNLKEAPHLLAGIVISFSGLISVALFSVVLCLFGSYYEKVKGDWYKSSQFFIDVWLILKYLYGTSACVKSLVGYKLEQRAGKVPINVVDQAQNQLYLAVRNALDIERKKERPTWELERDNAKQFAKAFWESLFRLKIIKDGLPRFYELANGDLDERATRLAQQAT